MTENESQKRQGALGRRQFLRSIFGLGTVADAIAPLEVEAKGAPLSSKVYWANLRNGQMGFPSGHYVPYGMPGSIMKLISVAALTDARVLSPDQKYECRGVYRLKNETFKCQNAHGLIDMTHALGLSCNIYFAKASTHVSEQTVLDYAMRFGLDHPVADFASGRFPASSGHELSANLMLGLSNDLQPSALQILRLTALIANQGKVPYLHSAEQPQSEAKAFELNLSDESWHVLKTGMQIASREGTGKKLDPENKMHLAIKTGTTPHGKKFQSWITGYFPWQDPHYAFVLRATSGTSQDEAVPQARAFLFSADWP